ncbi:unnamed protein product [Protopolystoma xenopodis]|uniref:Uncharacterized protein n=1 Tax=Protopolystoma xenopodis TaxID=117903 RepID=A0A3S5AC82_9PLAT|nr:unnamed protein product [Protopolystoma xenopodis]
MENRSLRYMQSRGICKLDQTQRNVPVNGLGPASKLVLERRPCASAPELSHVWALCVRQQSHYPPTHTYKCTGSDKYTTRLEQANEQLLVLVIRFRHLNTPWARMCRPFSFYRLGFCCAFLCDSLVCVHLCGGDTFDLYRHAHPPYLRILRPLCSRPNLSQGISRPQAGGRGIMTVRLMAQIAAV